MVGLTTYTEFKPNDFCCILLYTPILRQYKEEIEFLEGKVKSINHHPQDIPHDHPIWKFPERPPKRIQSICAEVTYDPKAYIRHPTDPILIHEEPGRHYLVIHPQECVRYLNKTIARKNKMNFVQQQKISQLEAAMNHYQRSR